MPISHLRDPRSRPTRPGGWLRPLLVTVLIAVGAVAGPGVTPALASSTGISGTVTDALSGQPASAVQVNIFDPSGTLVSSTCTASDGTYTFGGLGPGSYRVGFESTQGTFKVCGGRTNYLPTFYAAQATLAAATVVSVTVGATTTGIDAALEPGGAIAGTVSDATNSARVANIEVDAFDGAGSLVSATCTAPDGTYALFSLASGAYRVEFLNTANCGQSTPYRVQFYDGQTTLAAAHPVSVNVTQTTAGIDVGLIPTSAHTLTVTIAGPGTVAFSPAGVSCARSCILPVVGDKTITLTGSPSPGYHLAAWSGAGCSGAFVCTILINGDRAVTASFAAGTGSTGTGTTTGGGGGGTPPNGSTARWACTLKVVSGAVNLRAPRRTTGKRARRVRVPAPAVAVRYSCPQTSRLSLRTNFSFVTLIRTSASRRMRRRTHTAVVSLAPRVMHAGSGTLTVRLPAATLRALRAHRPVSARIDLHYSSARGAGDAVARIARLRAVI